MDTIVSAIPSLLPPLSFFWFSLSWQPRRMFERVGGAALFSVPGQTAVLNDRQISVALRQQWQFTVIIAVIIIICSFFSSLYYHLLLLSTPRQLQFGDYNTNTHTHTLAKIRSRNKAENEQNRTHRKEKTAAVRKLCVCEFSAIQTKEDWIRSKIAPSPELR